MKGKKRGKKKGKYHGKAMAHTPGAAASVVPQAEETDDLLLYGDVISCHPNASFKVRLENDNVVFATLCGKMFKHRIRVMLGDRVKVQLSPYDTSRGIISYREKN